MEEMSEDQVAFTLQKGALTLMVQAVGESKGALAAPKNGQMDHQIKEGLGGRIHFCLRNRTTGETVEDFSDLCGVEIVPRLSKVE